MYSRSVSSTTQRDSYLLVFSETSHMSDNNWLHKNSIIQTDLRKWRLTYVL